MSTLYVPTGTTRFNDSPFATLANSTFPSTRMSAGGTAAVCATVTDALSLGTPVMSLSNLVTTGGSPAAVGRWRTRSEFPPAVAASVFSARTLPLVSVNVMVLVPAPTAIGPMTVVVGTSCATLLPSTAMSTAVPGTPCTRYTVAVSSVAVDAAAVVPLATPPNTPPTNTAVTTNMRPDVYMTLP